MDLEKLKEPIPYKYRLQSAKYGKATIVSYIDSRAVQDRLDEVVGAHNWQDDYKVIDGNLFCGIAINVNGHIEGAPERWVTKTDVGTESNVDKEKGNSSDSFKRAAVKWGIGRFLYSLGIITLKTGTHKDKEYPATDEGKILWGVDELTEYCKKVVASGELDRTKHGVKPLTGAKSTTPKPAPTKQEQPKEDAELAKRKEAALKAFNALKKEPEIIAHLVKEEKLTYASVADFVKNESIDKVLEVYNKVK